MRGLSFSLVLGLGLSVCSGSATAQDASADVGHSQEIVKKFQTNKASVAYGAGLANLRSDLGSHAKPGKKVEIVLQDDLKFNDGSLLKKGTVLEGAVTSATTHSKEVPLSTLVIDWTTAEMPKKEMLPLAVMVRDAKGSTGFQNPERDFGHNQLGGTANSPAVGDRMSTQGNLILMNKKAGMPEIAPGVQMMKSEHSLSVASESGDLELHEGTQFAVVVFKDLAAAK